jgi:hypothetical protein
MDEETRKRYIEFQDKLELQDKPHALTNNKTEEKGLPEPIESPLQNMLELTRENEHSTSTQCMSGQMNEETRKRYVEYQDKLKELNNTDLAEPDEKTFFSKPLARIIQNLLEVTQNPEYSPAERRVPGQMDAETRKRL